MRCQKCGRPLQNPGIVVQMHGFTVTVGPKCAEGLLPTRKKRGMRIVGGQRRARRVEQRDLFEGVNA